MRVIKYLLPVCALLVSAGASSAPLVNLLPNSDFSAANGIAGWTFGEGNIKWATDDDKGVASSGSLELDMSQFILVSIARSPCMRVTSGAPFNFGAHAKTLTIENNFQMACSAFVDAACADTSPTLLGSANPLSLTTAWASIPTTSGTLVQRTGALIPDVNSVQCIILAQVTQDLAPTVVRVDDVFFNSELTVAATPATVPLSVLSAFSICALVLLSGLARLLKFVG